MERRILSALFFLMLLPVVSCPQATKPEVVAEVRGEAITKQQVFDLMLKRYPVQAQELIRELMVRAIIRYECRHEKMRIPTTLVRKQAQRELQETKAEVRRRGKSWQGHLTTLGLEESQLRRELLQKWKYHLAVQRLVRLYEFRRKWIEARHITVNTREKAQAILAKLNRHADFAALARRQSLSSSAARGGKFPPVFRGDLPRPLENAVFSMKPLKISPIIKTSWGFHIVQVLRIHPARPGVSWDQIKNDIVRSLKDKPISPRALQRWLTEMQSKYRTKKFY